MRALRVVAIASIVCLACSDSTALTLEGSPFMRAASTAAPFPCKSRRAFVGVGRDPRRIPVRAGAAGDARA